MISLRVCSNPLVLLDMIIDVGFADFSIEAPPSFLPPKRYCDITGLEVGGSGNIIYSVFNTSSPHNRDRIVILRRGSGITIWGSTTIYRISYVSVHFYE
jgi:hypothetical protein